MRVLRRAIAEKDGAGSVTMVPDDEEDIWHAYNLVNVGDRVETTAIRKVVREAAGSTSSSKVHIATAVDRVQYDGDTGVIRVSGTREPVRQAQAHTRSSRAGASSRRGDGDTTRSSAWRPRPIRARRRGRGGRDAARPRARVPHHAAMTLIKAKVELALRKRAPSVGHDKAPTGPTRSDRGAAAPRRFWRRQVRARREPGLPQGRLVAAHDGRGPRAQEKVLKNRTKFMLPRAERSQARASEVLAQPAVAAQVADTKAGDEVRAGASSAARGDQDRASLRGTCARRTRSAPSRRCC